MADIDLSSVSNFTPIGEDSYENTKFFKGTFDGNSSQYTISNLTISDAYYNFGLFAYNYGTIRNVKLTGVKVSSTSSYFVGGLVGQNNGTVQNCTVSGEVSGNDVVGALVGYNYGTVRNCTVSVTVSGNSYVGGLVGYNTGNITSNTVSGTVTGSSQVGGLAGINAYNYGVNCTVSNNTTITTVTGTGSNIGALVGQNELECTVSGNKYYTNQTKEVGTNDDSGKVENNSKLYKLTLPSGVTANGTITVTDNGVTYYAGNVTLSATDNNAVIRSTSYTNNDNGTVSFTPTADTNISSSDLTFYYAVSIPNCVQSVSGTSIDISGTTYYQNGATLTLTAKTGYTLDSTSVTVSANTSISATLADGYYVFGNATDGYTYATNDNVATNNYPDLVQVYKLTLSDGVTVTGDKVATDADGNTYAVGSVTLSAAAGYTLQNVSVDGEELTDNFTFNITADTKISADSIKFNNTNISAATGATVGGTTGNLSTFNGVYSISASQQNSTLVGNDKNNTVVLTGGGENILTGGSGNDTYKFTTGGGIVTDYGIGATKSGDGSTLSAAPGSDIVKVDGKVTGVYFDRAASNKNSANFTAVVAYDNTGDSTADQVVVLKDIIKKPTKYGSKPVYQTNDVAAATMKIWDTSGSSGKQAVLSAAKLKKLFFDDDQLTDELKTQLTTLSTNLGIGELNLPAVDALSQSPQASYSGDNG